LTWWNWEYNRQNFFVVIGLISNMGLLTSPLVAESFGLKAHGLIFGVINLSYSLGSGTGPLLAGYIFDITGSYIMAFLIYGMLGLAAVIVASLLRSTMIHRPSKKLVTSIGYTRSA